MNGPKRREGIVVAELGDGQVVASTAGGDTALVLNSTAAAVLELCDGTRSSRDIANFIRQTTNVDSRDVDADVEAIIIRFADGGLVKTE